MTPDRHVPAVGGPTDTAQHLRELRLRELRLREREVLLDVRESLLDVRVPAEPNRAEGDRPGPRTSRVTGTATTPAPDRSGSMPIACRRVPGRW
jgi:hypothetical protein